MPVMIVFGASEPSPSASARRPTSPDPSPPARNGTARSEPRASLGAKSCASACQDTQAIWRGMLAITRQPRLTQRSDTCASATPWRRAASYAAPARSAAPIPAYTSGRSTVSISTM
jgi:hypothetical protein